MLNRVLAPPPWSHIVGSALFLAVMPIALSGALSGTGKVERKIFRFVPLFVANLLIWEYFQRHTTDPIAIQALFGVVITNVVLIRKAHASRATTARAPNA